MTTFDVDSPTETTATSTYTIRNVRAVTDTAIIENASIVVIDGMIAHIGRGAALPPESIDGHNLLAVPGLVDSHSDGLEKEANPRRTAHFPLDYAITAFEGRLRSSGVTTVFHGVGYQDKPHMGRTVDGARQLNSIITERQRSGHSLVDHRVLYRFEARDEVALEPMLADLDAGRLGSTPLISFEDHTPGQGQYRDVQQFRAAINPDDVPDGLSVEQFVEQLIEEADQQLAARTANLARLSPLAKTGKIRMLAHDADSADDVVAAHLAGASIAEFPVSIEAATAARELDMAIVMGAPNALRGSSHSGNISARELVAAGLCDVLASDYLPPALLASACQLARQGCCSLVDAIGLITSGPASLAGLDDRGELAVGKRGDVVLIDDRGTWPSVVGVRRSDDSATLAAFG